MSSKRYPDEFKIEAVRQVVDRGFSVAEVAGRLGVSTHSMYEWLKKFGPAERRTEELDATQQELRRAKAELRRVTEERDILKKAAARSMDQCNTRYSDTKMRRSCNGETWEAWSNG